MRFFYLLLCVVLSFLGQAQNSIVSGVVQFSGEPIIGATVVNLSDGNGTITDLNGEFSIAAAENETLQISFLGFKTQKIILNSSTNYNIELISDNLLFDEVVVTALGLERESKSLGYSVEKLSSSEIDEVQSVNFLDNLGGKLAGVTVNQGATGVGSSSVISIRGESSFTNNNPLFVVDGIPVNNNTTFNVTNEQAAGFQEVDFGNGAMDINPADIESVSVLKGPGAAALYGTRASNGVIIINTKDGSKSKGIGVSFNSSVTIDRAFQLPEFQNTYGQGNSGQFEFVDGLGGGINDNITYSYGPQLDQGTNIPQFDSPVTLANGDVVRGGDVAVHGGLPITPSPWVSNPNNLRDFYQTGNTLTNNLSFGSAFDRGNFRVSFTDMQSESIIPGVNYDRRNLAARFKFAPTDRLQFNTSINYINSSSDNRPASGYGSENINYSLVAWLGRQSNLNSLRDYWQPGLEGTQQYSFNYTFFDNPYFILLENRNTLNRNRVFGNLSASYKFTDNLSLVLRSGLDNSAELRTFRRAFSSNRFRNGAYAEHNVNFREVNTDALLNYSTSLGKIAVDIAVGANRLDQFASTLQTQTTSLAQPGIFSLNNAASPLEVFDFKSRKRINSAYGLLKISYDDWLYADITGRNDWSSALATPTSVENTAFFYPSVSLSAVVSNAINLPEIISFAKVRASYAAVGNDTNPYETSGIFLASTPVYGQPSFTDQTSISNANLIPERTSAIELGTDLRFADDRIGIDFTYYSGRTTNQILSLPIAASTGYTQRILNGGEVSNQGIELLLNVNPIRKRDLKWYVSVNFSRNVARVTSLPEQADQITLAYSRVYDNPNQTVYFIVGEGDRIGDLWGTGYLKNDDGDFVIGDDGRYIIDNELKKLGNYNPDFIMGISNRVQWKNLSVGLVLDWRQGGELVSRTQALAGVAGQLKETENRPDAGIVAQGVTADGAVNTTPISAEAYYRQFYDRNHEENNTYDASYLKIREVSLTYRFTQVKSLENLSVSLIGRNLYAFSSIPHFDPEQIAVQGNGFIRGVEDMSYATTRSWGVSLNLDF